MELSITENKEKIRAQSFTRFLAEQNPHVFELIYRPLLEQADNGDRPAFHAINVIVCFMEQIDPFPRLSAAKIKEARRLAQADFKLFCRDELAAIEQGRHADVLAWGSKLIIWDAAAHGLLSEDPNWLQKTRSALFVIFHCLRQLR